MRAIALAVAAIQFGLAHFAFAQGPAVPPDRPIVESLPLFAKNRCAETRNPADQVFCADPELNRAGDKLNVAIQGRLNRLSDRRLAIAENAEWIRARNSSCGIFGGQNISNRDFPSVRQCLLNETDERITMLDDPNFDCLAANTAAGSLICSDPSLVIADTELNNQALTLIAKLKEDDAKEAYAEYARWIRARDRKCDLAGKENVPLEELPAAAQDCLAEYMTAKTAEIVAAKGDPKRVFGRGLPAPAPNADAVDSCVGQIHAANACRDFLMVSRVAQIDSNVTDQSASVLAQVEMVVLSPFAVCSPIASDCTGSCWDSRTGQAKPSPGNRDSFAVARRLRIEKSFEFKKADGGWRCSSAALSPVSAGVALGR